MGLHEKIYKEFANNTDEEWIETIFSSVDNSQINGVDFPTFPDHVWQIMMIGSTGKDALYEPAKLYREVRQTCKELGKSWGDTTTFLDFATGFGRNLRFYMKDVAPGNLYGSDVWDAILSLCLKDFAREGQPDVNFGLNEAFPPTKYTDNTFDIIILYSLFSHLSEDAHLQWLQEFKRILKPGGLVFVTIRQNVFMDYAKRRKMELDKKTPWLEFLKAKLNRLRITKRFSSSLNFSYEKRIYDFFSDAKNVKKYEAGELLFLPSVNERVLKSHFYGDTAIPAEFIEKNWLSDFEIVKNFDDHDRLPQALYCLKVKK